MRGTLLRLLVIAGTLLTVGVGAATASGPAPYDGEANGARLGLDILPTLVFGLGEIDLATLGVSDAALSTTGLVGATASSPGDGPHLFIVDEDGADCPNAAFTSIQEAVDAAGPDDRIRVCRGTYMEQVTIGAGKDGLTLFSQVPLAAVIKAPQPVIADPGDIVHVAGAQDVAIRQFTISGPLPDSAFCSLFTRTGVRIDSGGSALLYGNHITEIRSTSPALRGCQNGIGVLVGRQAEGQTGRATITHNLIDRYQKGAVVVDNAGSFARIDHNEIVREGPDPIIAPNGIQVSRGAGADAGFNEVSGNSFANSLIAAGTGVILFQAGSNLTVHHNDVFANDDGISLYDTDGSLISHNRSHDQRVYDGLYADSNSTGNTFEFNDAYRNVEHDCHDDSVGAGTAGTANFWIKDKGSTENRPGLCKASPGQKP